MNREDIIERLRADLKDAEDGERLFRQYGSCVRDDTLACEVRRDYLRKLLSDIEG